MPREILYHAIALATAGQGDGRTRWHVILTVGTQEGRPLGGRESPTYTVEDLRGLASSFAGPVPVGIHHATYRGETTGDPRWFTPDLSGARGWIVAVKEDAGQLLAQIEWTEEGAQLIDSHVFRFFSIEMGRRAEGAPLQVLGGTLTNDPFWDLPPLDVDIAAGITDIPLAVYAGGTGSSGPDSTRRPHDTDDGEEDTMPTKEELLEQITALTAERDRLREQQDGGDKTALQRERDELAAKLARLERQAETDRERRYQDDLARAMDAGLENDEAVLETARKRWDLTQETGEDYWSEFIVAHCTVRTGPSGRTGSSAARRTAKPSTAQEAGAILHDLALARMAESDDDYTAAFIRVARDPGNAAIAEVYELPGSKEV